MQPHDIVITTDDHIIKVTCLMSSCKNHLILLGEAACNLKHIRISAATAGCMEYEPREEKQEVNNATT